MVNKIDRLEPTATHPLPIFFTRETSSRGSGSRRLTPFSLPISFTIQTSWMGSLDVYIGEKANPVAWPALRQLNRPIFERQIRNPREMPHVEGRHSQTVRLGCCCDQQVEIGSGPRVTTTA